MATLLTVARHHWHRLVRGEHIVVDATTVEHPSISHQLVPLSIAWPDGQTCDYACRLDDGSRIHVHCVAVGGRRAYRVHRDRWDPGRGPLHAIAHGTLETRLGWAVLGPVLQTVVRLQLGMSRGVA